jgi:uncharacterized protein (DUF1810 family)
MAGMLDRFRDAQAHRAAGFETALRELEAGRKRSHWIWYVFPQLAGLGSSPMAVEYGVRDLDEATAYLRDPVLSDRLLAVTDVIATHVEREPRPRLADLLGSSIDARKVVSSLTLFGELARRLHETDPRDEYDRLATRAAVVLRAAHAEGLPECDFTQRVLRRVGEHRTG